MSNRIFLQEMFLIVRKYAKSILATIGIVYLSLASSSDFDGFRKLNLFQGFDKLIHFLMYFILGVFLLVEFGQISQKKFFSFLRVTVAFFYPVMLGILMEIFQYYFTKTRYSEFADVLFNTGGVTGAWLIFAVIVTSSGYLKKK